MKKLSTFALFLLPLWGLGGFLFAQSVTIDPKSTATNIIDAKSNSHGMAVPKMTTVQKNAIANKVEGMMTYDTDIKQFSYWNGTVWVNVTTGGGGSSQWTSAGSNIYYDSGNVGIGTVTPSSTTKLDIQTGTAYMTAIDAKSTGNFGVGIAGHGRAIGISGEGITSSNAIGGYFTVSGTGTQKALKAETTSGGTAAYFSAPGGNALITEQGNVGIGASAPSQKMDVNGKIKVGDDAQTATEGSIRYNTSAKTFEGYDGSEWVGFNTWQLNGTAGNEIKNTNSGGFWSANPTGLSFSSTDVTNPPTAPVSGAGTRLMWIPSRSAFRVGTINYNQWDAANVGLFSIALGQNTIANGIASTAMGYNTTASKEEAVAMGFGTIASGNFSFAMGDNTTASGWSSVAMGRYTLASGSSSTAMGYGTTASGDFSTAMGQFNVKDPNALLMVGNGNGDSNPLTAFVIKKNNRVGIGINEPLAPLHVAGQSTISGGGQGHLFNFGSTTLFGYTGAENPSIVADASILSKTTIGAFQAISASDNRIKNIIGLSDNAEDLARLRKIEITNYRMKDQATWGNKIFKKVIAQQVERIYPEVIKFQTAVIPDIYTLAESVEYNDAKKELKVLMSKEYNIKIGDKIRLIDRDKGESQAEVVAVEGKSFTVKNWLTEAKQIFVFGREVNDFRSVDYEALSMLGISAIQQLAKENEELRMKNEKMEARLDRIEAALQSTVQSGK